MNSKHYQQAGATIEPIVLCSAFPFCFGNVIKYITRAPFKGSELSDYCKALDYLDIVLLTEEHAQVQNIIAHNMTLQTLMLKWPNRLIQMLANPNGIQDLQYLRDELVTVIDSLKEEAADDKTQAQS